MKKYTVEYISGATGYGWEEDYDRLDQFEDFIDEMRNEYTAKVTVYDNELPGFIFWKNVLTYDIDIDILTAPGRDMRTKNRIKQ